MTSAEMIACIVDEVERRVADALNLTEHQIYEIRETGEQDGAAAYVSASIPQFSPMTQCADVAFLEITIGFELFDDGARPKRTQRLEAQMRLRDALVWNARVGCEIVNAKIPEILEMPVSELGDPRHGTFTGGLIWRCRVHLPRGC